MAPERKEDGQHKQNAGDRAEESRRPEVDSECEENDVVDCLIARTHEKVEPREPVDIRVSKQREVARGFAPAPFVDDVSNPGRERRIRIQINEPSGTRQDDQQNDEAAGDATDAHLDRAGFGFFIGTARRILVAADAPLVG